jgi:glycosyltransferase involved in cell wall biosynthesis
MAQGDAEPKVTVIMPTYQHAQYLPLSVFSVLQQSVPVKLIIIPVKTDTDTISTIHKLMRSAPMTFDPSSMCWEAAEKPDVFAQMQLGLAMTDTEYFCVFGSDDFMLPNMIERLLYHAQGLKNPIVALSFATTYADLTINSIHYNKHFKLSKQMKGSYIPDISLVKTESARKVGGFTRSEKDWGYLNHFAFYHRLLAEGGAEVKLSREVGFLYRQLTDSRHATRYKTKKDIKVHKEKMKMIARYYWGK